MRRLLLLRHAKAERLQPGGRDHDRVLADRGRADAHKLGAYLARHGYIPDRAWFRPRRERARPGRSSSTAFGKAPPVSFEDRIYEASPQAILQVIKETGPKTGTLLVDRPQPGMQELAAMLVASGDIDARERLGENFPTSALAAISFAPQDWRGVHPHGGRLEHFVTPDWLATATD